MQFIFHIGQQKTASTAIQSHLAYNRARLAEQGVLYPSALGAAKAALITDLFSKRPGLAATRATIMANFEAELRTPCSRVLLSDENLFGWNRPPNMPPQLREAFQRYATSWRVLCYLRRPDEQLASLYQQNVKGGYPGTLEQSFEERLSGSYYSYARRMERWAEVFGEDAVEVRLFHRKALKGTPFEDFAHWLGLDPALLPPSPKERSNESLDRLNTEALRLVNLLRTERPELLHRHDLKKVMDRMRKVDTGEPWRLSGEQARRLHDHVRADHEELARRYLSDAEAELLLAPPAEGAPPPPLDRDALHARFMVLFKDATLARAAVDRADQPVDVSLLNQGTRASREMVAARAVAQFDYRSKLERSAMRRMLHRFRFVPRVGRAIARTFAKALRPR